MKKLWQFVVKFRFWFLGIWLTLTAISAILIPFVKVNYDTTDYLPENTRVKQSLKVMEEEFGLTGQAAIMIDDVGLQETLVYKDKLKSMPYVSDIIWLDTMVDRATIETIAGWTDTNDPDGIFELSDIPGLNAFYKERSALLQVIFTESDYSLNVGKTIEEMRAYLTKIDKPFAMSGTAINAYNSRIVTEKEVFKVTLYVIPIILLILIIFTRSWAEPLIFLITVGVSVVINMGTNIFFPSVSFLTNSTASLLQLAISMDYSIFLLHAYQKEKKLVSDKKEAMVNAMKKSFTSISASMLTTVAGFVALMFMRYTIGLDLAGVMIKGIILSLVVTFTFMPSLILASDKLITKLEHRPFFPKIGKLTKVITKLRYVVPAILTLAVVPAYYAQTQNNFIYGDAAMNVKGDEGPGAEKRRIDEKFGKSNMIVVLVPIDENGLYVAQEKAMIRQLSKEFEKSSYDYKVSIQSYNSMLDIKTYIPNYDVLPEDVRTFFEDNVDESVIQSMISDNLKDQFISEHYSRVIITINTDTECPEAEAAVTIVETTVARQPFADDAYIIGVSPSVKEIKTVVETDYIYVNILSIVFVLVILIFVFKSPWTPLVLLFVIELGIWINMAIPYLTKTPLIFIGFMIVSSVQLGATIDYGILFTQFYIEARKTMYRRDAIKYALDNGGHSILTSSLILTSAGYSLKFFSSVEATSGIGELIGRGALLSGVLVIFFLPMLLYLFDKAIEKTTLRAKFYRPMLSEEEKKVIKKIDRDDTILY